MWGTTRLTCLHASSTKSWPTDSDPNDLVFIPNATTGTNTVVMSCVKNMKPGDSIVTLNTAYGMFFVLHILFIIMFQTSSGTVQTLLEYVAPQYELDYYQIDISFPPKSNKEVSNMDTIVDCITNWSVLSFLSICYTCTYSLGAKELRQ